MTDHEALVRAACASPDDDLPRLVLADYLEEQGDPAQAEFIRTQVQLATTPPWEPFAVRVKHRRPELMTGEPWKATLPRFGNGAVADWNPDGAFKRGFGHSLHVKQLTTFLEMAPHLLQVCPVQELILPSGTQDDWRNLMKAPWLANIRSVKFTFASNLIEPVRALGASDYATNIESVAFDVCTSPAMGVIVEALVQSPLAKNLKRLSFSMGSDLEGEILNAMNSAGDLRLKTLALKSMGLTSDTFSRMVNAICLKELECLKIENELFNEPGQGYADITLTSTWMNELSLHKCRSGSRSINIEMPNSCLKSLIIDESAHCRYNRNQRLMQSLKTLRLSGGRGSHPIYSSDIIEITKMECWPAIVELDLSHRRHTFREFGRFSHVEIPESLEALILDDNMNYPVFREKMQLRFGERLVLK